MTREEVDARISRSSRRNAPKKGTTRHSAMAKARLRALSYSADSNAADKKSKTGKLSFSVIDNQNGFNLFDLKHNNKSLNIITMVLLLVQTVTPMDSLSEAFSGARQVVSAGLQHSITPLEAERNPCTETTRSEAHPKHL